VAELLEPGLGPEALLERLAGVRRGVRDAFERVLAARTIRAL
jgi:hypothetical protein